MREKDRFTPSRGQDLIHRVTRTQFRRHFYAVCRFVEETHAVVCITFKGKDDLVLLSVKWFERVTGRNIRAEIEAMMNAKREVDEGIEGDAGLDQGNA